MAGSDWQKLIRESELQDGIPVPCDLGKKKVLVVKRGEQIHACSGKCTHYGGPLAKGLLVGDVITCPWHNARFDVTNGKATAPALDSLGCYETRVENGEVYVRPKERTKPAVKPGTEGQFFVIVGAGAAGNAAAETLRNEGFGGRIVMVTPEKHLPYDRPNLSKEFLAGKAKVEWIPLRSSEFYEKEQIEVLTERAVVSVDPGKKSVALSNGEALSYDRLLLASGSRPRALTIPGAELDGVFLLRSRDDTEAIIGALDGARTAVVIGASFIGLEVAAALIERKLKVHVVAPETVPMARILGEPLGNYVRSLHEKHGVTFHLGVKPAGVDGAGRVRSVKLSNGTALSADLVIAGIGVTPAVEYLAGTSLVVEGQVPVDERLRTSEKDIFAAGDIAAAPYAPLGQRIRVEHWAVAERQGQHAARSMLGSDAPYDEVPFFWSQHYDKSISYAGFGAGFDHVAQRGTIGDEGFLLGYYRGETLLAVASLWRDVEFMALSELIKMGRPIGFKQFQDESLDLKGLLSAKP